MLMRPCSSLQALRRDVTSLDRYITIRTFFKQSFHSPTPSAVAVRSQRPITSATRPAPIHGLRISGLGLHSQKYISRTAFRYRDKNRSQATEVPPPDTVSARKGNSDDAPNNKDDGSSAKGKSETPETYHLNLDNYSRFYRRLLASIPPMHRPTKDALLQATTSVWERLRIRFRWFTIRSFRKFNADEMSAFLTWFLMSQTLWILVGTTTFFSVIFATANSLRLQEFVAKVISDYLTSETGITIIFESAIVPKWKDSVISFKNVYISRRPQPKGSHGRTMDQIARAVQHVAINYDIGNHPTDHGLIDEDELTLPDDVEDDTNYSMFDLNVDSIDVTLSFYRWLEGKGLVKDAVMKGVRGVLDRRYVYWDPEHSNPAAFRHKSQPGDFEMESLQIEDLLITVLQPGSFRPYTASIFNADIKTFRKRWLFYDFLAADSVVGQIDNCLFSLHKPQSIGRTNEQDLRDGQWSRMARFRIDGVNIDHLKAMTSEDGPISWITSGKVDAVFDIKFPRAEDEFAIDALLGEIADAAVRLADRIPGQRELAKPAISAPSDPADSQPDTPQVVSVDIDLRFRDLKAAIPLFTDDLSYMNNALIRPIVAFINANRTLVPIQCKVLKNLDAFDGSWTMWETGLMDDIAIKVYDALAYHVTQANFEQRVKTVSKWSLQLTVQAALSALQSMVDPMSARLQQQLGTS